MQGYGFHSDWTKSLGGLAHGVMEFDRRREIGAVFDGQKRFSTTYAKVVFDRPFNSGALFDPTKRFSTHEASPSPHPRLPGEDHPRRRQARWLRAVGKRLCPLKRPFLGLR